MLRVTYQLSSLTCFENTHPFSLNVWILWNCVLLGHPLGCPNFESIRELFFILERQKSIGFHPS